MGRRSAKATDVPAPKVVRCAIYTRKSTEEGLEQAFNSLDAQREAGEAYVAAQRHEGWACLPDRYDDGGYSGGNTDRPALQRLLADVRAGKVDAVIVYKVDRLSRSLLDFARIMEVLDAAGASFVSVTQNFSSATSMGRLTLNVLLSFAQFEREIISERTRDKVAAARRKGKWHGGFPVLGYDLVSSPAGPRLVVNEIEAEQVRAIFRLYLRHRALLPVVRELADRGWANKLWTTKKGVERGGRAFDKATLYKLLTCRTYLGVVTYRGQDYPGEHQGIVDAALFEEVRALLGRNGRTRGAEVRNKHGALLKGLIHCSCCRCAMSHSFTARAGRRYHYYVCTSAQKNGWDTCPSKSVPAGEVEAYVVEQVKRAGRDPAVLAATLRQVRGQQQRELAELAAEAKRLQREVERHRRAGDEVQLQAAEKRLTGIKDRLERVRAERVDEAEAAAALAAFEPLWNELTPRERERVLQLLVQRVEYDGRAGTIAITFHASGIKALAREQGHGAAGEAA